MPPQALCPGKIRVSHALHILVVEDHGPSRAALGLWLSQSGHRIALAHSASHARALARREYPEVLLCDWDLGGATDGLALCRELLEEVPEGASPPEIILVTSHDVRVLRRRARSLGVRAVLPKPVDLAALEALLAQVESAHVAR
jgi:CheY-like chemotaxis protein